MRRGFTLIELMIVVAICGIIAAIILPKVFPHKFKDETAIQVARVWADKLGSGNVVECRTPDARYSVCTVFRTDRDPIFIECDRAGCFGLRH